MDQIVLVFHTVLWFIVRHSTADRYQQPPIYLLLYILTTLYIKRNQKGKYFCTALQLKKSSMNSFSKSCNVVQYSSAYISLQNIIFKGNGVLMMTEQGINKNIKCPVKSVKLTFATFFKLVPSVPQYILGSNLSNKYSQSLMVREVGKKLRLLLKIQTGD